MNSKINKSKACHAKKNRSMPDIEIIDSKKNNKRGMLQYFYHCKTSKLPIRDVKDTHGKHHKPEPHIEIGAENYASECYQRNINEFVNSHKRHLFLITTCYNKDKNNELKNKYGIPKKSQFVVGHIDVDTYLRLKDRRKGEWICVKGKVKILDFTNAYRMEEMFGKNYDAIALRHNPHINAENVRKLLRHFKNKTNILRECIDAIRENDKSVSTCRYGKECKFRNECLRWRAK
jgi:hypothetical protein